MSEKSLIDIERLGNGELRAFKSLISLFKDVFEMEGSMMPDDNHLQQLLNKSDFHVLVALAGEKVVGG